MGASIMRKTILSGRKQKLSVRKIYKEKKKYIIQLKQNGKIENKKNRKIKFNTTHTQNLNLIIPPFKIY